MTAAPRELRHDSATRTLRVVWADGAEDAFSAEFLRVNSPSAETRGHGGRRPPPPAGKRGVAVTAIQPVGRYAVRIHFDDGHDTGIYSWAYLRECAQRRDALWDAYRAALKAEGLSRDPDPAPAPAPARD